MAWKIGKLLLLLPSFPRHKSKFIKMSIPATQEAQGNTGLGCSGPSDKPSCRFRPQILPFT